MRKKTWKTSSIAECADCDWTYENYKNAQAVGAKHAKDHNHFVRVETVLASYYNYPEGYFQKEGDSKDE